MENEKCAEIGRYSFIWHTGIQDLLDRFFTIFTLNESVLGVDDRSGRLILIS